jgi:hypothetical protein
MNSSQGRFVLESADCSQESDPETESGERPVVPPDRDTLEDLTQVEAASLAERKPSQIETIPAPPESDWDLDAWTKEPPTGPGNKPIVVTS